jgi:hypothetical protein
VKFSYLVEVEVKNDAGTQEIGRHDLAMMVLGILEANRLSSVPWVINQHYTLVKE